MTGRHLDHTGANKVTSELVDLLIEIIPEIKKFDREQFIKGFEIEQEHADTTGNNVITIAKIALDHLKEFPDYYTRLIKMEKAARDKLN